MGKIPKLQSGTICHLSKAASIFIAFAIFLLPNISFAAIPTNGLVGYWSFDNADISGTTAIDGSGSGNNGTIMNGATTGVAGKVGEAISFDGVDDYVSIKSSVVSGSSFDMTGSLWTQSAWVKWDGTTYSRGIMTFSDSANHNNGITNSNIANYGRFMGIIYTGTGGTIYNVCTTVAPEANTWYHVVAVWDGTYALSMSMEYFVKLAQAVQVTIISVEINLQLEQSGQITTKNYGEGLSTKSAYTTAL